MNLAALAVDLAAGRALPSLRFVEYLGGALLRRGGDDRDGSAAAGGTAGAGTRMNKALLITYRFPPQGGGRRAAHAQVHQVPARVRLGAGRADGARIRTGRCGTRLAAARTCRRACACTARRRSSSSGSSSVWRAGGQGKDQKRIRRGGRVSASAADVGRARQAGVVGRLRQARASPVLVPDAQIAWLPRRPGAQPGDRAPRGHPARLYDVAAELGADPGRPGRRGSCAAHGWPTSATRGPTGRAASRPTSTTRTRERIEKAAERWIVRRADRVLVSAEPLRARFLAKYPFLSPDKVVVLTNGFDPSDFDASEDASRDLEPGGFHMSGAGNIEAMFDARPLFTALAAAMAAEPGSRRGPARQPDRRAQGQVRRRHPRARAHRPRALRRLGPPRAEPALPRPERRAAHVSAPARGRRRREALGEVLRVPLPPEADPLPLGAGAHRRPARRERARHGRSTPTTSRASRTRSSASTPAAASRCAPTRASSPASTAGT